MARADDNERKQAGDEQHEPRECMACRGTGRVISNLGGTQSTVVCPWCEGGGLRLQDRDAQARWQGEGAPGESQGVAGAQDASGDVRTGPVGVPGVPGDAQDARDGARGLPGGAQGVPSDAQDAPGEEPAMPDPAA